MGLVFAFALGMLGGVHCMAMCGPLMVAMPTPPGSAAGFVFSRLLYQCGRMATYVLLGVFAALVGRSFYLIGLQRWLSVALGIVVLAGFFLSGKLSASAMVTRCLAWLKAAMSRQLRVKGYRSLFLMGMLNGLLPCGLVYAALAGAAAASSEFSAILAMAAFGLGTLPAMLSASLWGRFLPMPWRWQFRRMIPLGVCGLAALLILRGLSLGIPYVSPDLTAPNPGCCIH